MWGVGIVALWRQTEAPPECDPEAWEGRDRRYQQLSLGLDAGDGALLGAWTTAVRAGLESNKLSAKAAEKRSEGSGRLFKRNRQVAAESHEATAAAGSKISERLWPGHKRRRRRRQERTRTAGLRVNGMRDLGKMDSWCGVSVLAQGSDLKGHGVRVMPPCLTVPALPSETQPCFSALHSATNPGTAGQSGDFENVPCPR
ncbi:unnamed protein product [Pleuronectes platessa]|uniref:Uncharacterized protein n=1 Tax=Pleuronectes platessa TaxID=8262 RepID=A0A9N7UDZ9_PLEPL|nr:unnamed protein product [Pleuronectes platessa]